MHITISHTELIAALTTVAGSITRRSTLPILEHVCIKADEVGAIFMTTNLECATLHRSATHVERQGTCTINHKELLAVVKPLTTQEISLRFENDILAVSTDGLYAPLQATNGEDYPTIPVVQGEPLTMASEPFWEMCSRVAYTAATNDARPVLTCVMLTYEERELSLVACESNHLSLDCMELPGGRFSTSLIPARCLELARKKLPKKGDLTIVASEAQIALTCGPVQFVSRLVEGTYPCFRRVIPKESEIKTAVLVDRKALLRAITIVEPIVKDVNNFAKLHISSSLEIKAKRAGMADFMTVTVDAATRGNEMDLGIDHQHMKRLLTALSAPQLRFEFNDAQKPYRVTIPGVPGFVAVSMPRLSAE